ncbi:hypothetical protein [Aquitalea pelogenes]|uniref:hypothetical protein n=1 Tax=Aquitalea pelogenes TaxID=1293573 RepID=UPI0035B07123
MNANNVNVKDMLANTADQNTKGGYIPVGFKGNSLFVYSFILERIVEIRSTQMTEMTLKSVCGAKWCEDLYMDFHTKKEEVFFNHKRLATDIIAQCQEAGPYSLSVERTCGVWPSSDHKRLLVNSSQLWDSEGKVIKRGQIEGRFYPTSGDVGFGPDTPLATGTDVNRILKAFGAVKWQSDMVPEMLLGWLVVATCAPALARRPHMYVSARAGTGKTALLSLMSYLLDSQALRLTGPQTFAALYQQLGSTNRAVILDEFEADASNRRNKETLEIARISYSLQENDNGISRGTCSGEAKNYRFFTPFLAASVVPGKFEPADLSRWVIVEAIGKQYDDALLGKSSEAQQEAILLGQRLRALAIHRWSVFQDSLDQLSQAIQRNGGDDRIADTVGPLLAGYWSLVSDKPASASDADMLVEMGGLSKHIEQREESDEVRCLDTLFSKVLTLPLMEGNCLVRKPISISEAIQAICDDPTGTPEMQQRLAQYGLRVSLMKGDWKVFIANSVEHQELRKLFRGSKWQHGGWSMTLRRLPGGEESTQRLGAGFKACKVTVFDVPADLLPANEDETQLSA